MFLFDLEIKLETNELERTVAFSFLEESCMYSHDNYRCILLSGFCCQPSKTMRRLLSFALQSKRCEGSKCRSVAYGVRITGGLRPIVSQPRPLVHN